MLKPSKESMTNFEAGSYFFITVKELDCIIGHPFSVASAPGLYLSQNAMSLFFLLWCIFDLTFCDNQTFTTLVTPGQSQLDFYIKNMGPGTWTDKLYKMALNNPSVTVEGPYGKITLGVDLQNSDNVILCAGGIGITPMMSIFVNM